MATLVIAGLCLCVPAQNENDAENTIWATLDGQRSLLFYSPPNHDWLSTYSTRSINIDGTSFFYQYYDASWTTIQESQVLDKRDTNTLVITRMLSKTFPLHLFRNFYRIENFQMTHQGLTQLTPDNFENALFV